MSPLVARILIVGVPLLISLSWFFFWFVRLIRAGRKVRARTSVKEPPAGSA